jgi:hypothetical protein
MYGLFALHEETILYKLTCGKPGKQGSQLMRMIGISVNFCAVAGTDDKYTFETLRSGSMKDTFVKFSIYRKQTTHSSISLAITNAGYTKTLPDMVCIQFHLPCKGISQKKY